MLAQSPLTRSPGEDKSKGRGPLWSGIMLNFTTSGINQEQREFEKQPCHYLLCKLVAVVQKSGYFFFFFLLQ